MLISELIKKLQAVQLAHGDRQAVKVKILSEATRYELVDPQLVIHYVDPADETNYVVQIV